MKFDTSRDVRDAFVDGSIFKCKERDLHCALSVLSTNTTRQPEKANRMAFSVGILLQMKLTNKLYLGTTLVAICSVVVAMTSLVLSVLK